MGGPLSYSPPSRLTPLTSCHRLSMPPVFEYSGSGPAYFTFIFYLDTVLVLLESIIKYNHPVLVFIHYVYGPRFYGPILLCAKSILMTIFRSTLFSISSNFCASHLYLVIV